MGCDKRLLTLVLALFSLAVAETSAASNSLPPRLSANAYASDYTIGQADLMLPLNSNYVHNFYIDPNVAYGTDNQAYADLGVGYRWIRNSSAILGGYLFGGYSRIDNNARLWVVNPGIEALGSRWDAHLNAYLVMGDRNTSVSSFFTFDEFNEHSELFNLFNAIQHAGDGADAKLGYQLFAGMPLKAYVGSYFFSPAQTNNVLGGAVGLEYWFDSHVKVFANYTYDNYQHSTGALGLGIEFGGTHVHRSDPSIEERITDPVERYLANLGHGSAIPSRKATQMMGQAIPLMNDLVFFSQTGTPNNGGMGLTVNNCTFENPCGPTDLTDVGTATLSGLFPNTEIFFEGGTYDALDVVNGTNPVTIRTGQSLSSAPGTAPSTLNGGFIFQGNNTLNNIILEPTGSTATGSGITAAGGNAVINGSQIGSMATPFATGVAFSGNTQANLNNSTVFASSNGVTTTDSAGFTSNASRINVNGGANSFGITSSSSGPLNLTQGSLVNVTGVNNTVGVNSTGGGDFILSDASSINVTGANNSIGLHTEGAGTTTVNEASSINLDTSGTNSVGYFDQGSGAVNFNGASSINVKAAGTSSAGYAHVGSALVNFNEGSSINVNAAGQNMAAGFGDAIGASGDITFDASFVNVTGADDTIGFSSEGTGNLNIINGSAVNVTGGNDSSGLEILGNRHVNFLDSKLSFTGGDNSFGFSFQGNGNITLGASTFNLTGGSSFLGCDTEGSGAFTVSGSTFNISGGANSFVCQIAGSGLVNFSGGNSLTMNAAGQASVGGIHTTAASSSALTFNDSQINVTGGTNPIGLFSEGTGDLTVSGGSTINVIGASGAQGFNLSGSSGVIDITDSSITVDTAGQNTGTGIFVANTIPSDITLDNSQITVTGGDIMRGFNYFGSGNVGIINGSTINVTGGNDVRAFSDSGTGPVNLIGSTLIANATGLGIGFTTTVGTPSVVTSNGSQITVTGGDTTRGFGISGTGNIDLTNTSITVNAVTNVGNTVSGILMNGSGSSIVTVSGGSIRVLNGNNVNGVVVLGTGTINLQNSNLVNVNGSGRALGISINTNSGGGAGSGGGSITGNNINVSTVSTGGQALGLFTAAGTSGSITISGSNLNVSGNGSSAIRQDLGGGTITVTGSICMLNGSPTPC